MLEYLLNFIENNLFLIFLCLIILGIASIYSKGIKFLFLSILGGAALYFALLCLHHWGVGIEFLYKISSKYVIAVCEQIDYYSILFFNHSLLITKFMEIFLPTSMSSLLFYVLHISVFITVILIAAGVILPHLCYINLKKVEIRITKVNKINYFYNTINKTQSKFILNSVFRC